MTYDNVIKLLDRKTNMNDEEKENLKQKMDMFFLFDRLTKEEYNNIMNKMGILSQQQGDVVNNVYIDNSKDIDVVSDIYVENPTSIESVDNGSLIKE